MLIRVNQLKGLKIYSIDTGEKLEDINDLIFDPRSHKVEALLVQYQGLFSDAKMIPFEAIKSFGEDAVMVESYNVLRKTSELPDHILETFKHGYLKNTKILTEDGTDLGQITDILFDPQTGEVKEVELSQGALENMRTGKKRVNLSDIKVIGKDATIVNSTTKDAVNSQIDETSLKSRWDKGISHSREKSPEILEEAKATFKKLTQKTKNKIQEINDHPKTKEQVDYFRTQGKDAKNIISSQYHQINTKITDKRRRGAAGGYLTKTILLPDDQILGQRGDMITNNMLDQAEKNGLLDEVLSHSSERPSEV